VQGYLEINEDDENYSKSMTKLNIEKVDLSFKNPRLEIMDGGYPKTNTYVGYNLELGYNFKGVEF